MGSFFPHQQYNSNNNHQHSAYPFPTYDAPRGSGYGNSHGSNRRTRPFVDTAMDNDDFNGASGPGMGDPSFDILEWHPAYLSCQRYFLDHAQYEPGTQAVCALINIRLPFQWLDTPIIASSSSSSAPPTGQGSGFNFNAYPRAGGSNVNSPHSRGGNENNTTQHFVSPVPYIRRLIVTGFDKSPILHGFFGDDYVKGIMPHVECERRNYLFAAKHGGWRSCKKQYDVGSGHGGDETVPFLKPLDQAKEAEIAAAEQTWSDWLAMEDWQIGPRELRGNDSRQERYRGGTQRPGVPDASEIDGVPEGYRSR